MADFSGFLNLVNNCDPDDPLLSSTRLGQELDRVPLKSIKPSDIVLLTKALNVEQLITTEKGLQRDYRGLAELMGFSSIDTETRFKRTHNPVKSLIDAYVQKNIDLNCCISLNDLLKMIEAIERFDVIDDFMPNFIALATQSATMSHRHNQFVQVDQSPHRVRRGSVTGNLTNKEIIGTNGLLEGNRNNQQFLYDAFVCFAPMDDKYAYEMINLLERNDKRVATADVLLPGYFEHDALMRLIDEKCHKVIIILTPNFLESKECDFQTKYASEVSIKEGSLKIIPVLYERCDYEKLPRMIQVLSKIDLTNEKFYHWQLRKLLNSLSYEFEQVLLPTEAHNFSNYLMSQPESSRNVRGQLGSAIRLENSTTFPALSNNSRSITPTISNDCEVGPIIDLLDSQSLSSSLSRGRNLSPDIGTDELEQGFELRHSNTSPMIGCSVSNGPLNTSKNWLKNFRKKIFGESASSNDSFQCSTSSKAMLITSNFTQSSLSDSENNCNDS